MRAWSETMLAAPRTRRVIRVGGVVQGVGFRPFVCRLATELGLTGFVRNDRCGVVIEVEGAAHVIERFVCELAEHAPPLARIETIDHTTIAAIDDASFGIAHSDERRVARSTAQIPIDAAPCDDCLRELFDPADRRHRYPFINCTACGPRFTIVEGVPYDRRRTTMAHFDLCAACRREYEDPRDRRFHAEPNACPDCGPELSLIDGEIVLARSTEALRLAIAGLDGGAILAVKGAGGYALAVSATDPDAIDRLRARKRRPHKPFAIMARSLADVERVAVLDDAARAALTSPRRPIVLVPRRADAPIAESVAPAVGDLGVFLPPTPLQHLLVADGPPLQVMTSGNVSNEPIARGDDEALRELASVADLFLLHDRPIHRRADDSVVRIIAGAATTFRRARGFVPEHLPLPSCPTPVLAVGAQSKSTVCLGHDGRADVSPHLGDLGEPATRAWFEESIAAVIESAGVHPEVCACDLHPDYASTRWARSSGLPVIAVQHHHAHVAACLAEHGRTDPVLGVAFDGTGYGPGGALWGGEILVADLGGIRPVARLRSLLLAGGEAAIREPWRLALAALIDAGETDDILTGPDHRRVSQVTGLLGRGPSALASGAGRWFDAVAALCGVRHRISYDGQAAIELEAVAEPGDHGDYPLALGPHELDLRPTIRAIAGDLRRGVEATIVAARFHDTLAAGVARACRRARDHGAPGTVVLTGGCFQNRRLCERTIALLSGDGFEVLTHRRCPPNDGGLSLGQAAVASAVVSGAWQRTEKGWLTCVSGYQAS